MNDSIFHSNTFESRVFYSHCFSFLSLDICLRDGSVTNQVANLRTSTSYSSFLTRKWKTKIHTSFMCGFEYCIWTVRSVDLRRSFPGSNGTSDCAEQKPRSDRSCWPCLRSSRTWEGSSAGCHPSSLYGSADQIQETIKEIMIQ